MTPLTTIRTLDSYDARRLGRQALTYPEVGATSGPHPQGYRSLSRSRVLRRRDLDGATRDLLGWEVQRRAGLTVLASSVPAVNGSDVLLRLGPGPVSLRIPCRVVSVVDEPDRRGFAYGTLPGHPERGEERFLVERREDGSLVFTVSAFSRPATVLARAGGPVATAFQRLMADRYLAALDR